MIPIFTDDDLFIKLVSYAKAAARSNDRKNLDRASFNFGVAYALASRKVETPYKDLPIPNEAALIAAAEESGYHLAGLQPYTETLQIEDGFRLGFVARHIELKSSLHTVLKDVLGAIATILADHSQAGGTTPMEVPSPHAAELPSLYYSIVIAADREDFGRFLPILTVNPHNQEKSNQVRERSSEGVVQYHKLNTLVAAEGKVNKIQAESQKQVSEIDFGSPLCIPLVPDVEDIRPLPHDIVLDRSELRLYVCKTPEEKTIRIRRLPENPHVWQLGLPPGTSVRDSAHIIRAAAARVFLLATVGRKKIETSNLLRSKAGHDRGGKGGADEAVPTYGFPFDTTAHVLGVYHLYCLAVVLLCYLVHPLLSLPSFLLLAQAVSKDFRNARTRLLQLASMLDKFWAPQLGLTLLGLAVGIYPPTAQFLHVDFLSAMLYGCIPLLFSFVLVSIDFQPQEEKDAIERHEEIHQALTTHMHEITQTTLSVALGNLDRDPSTRNYSYIPEVLVDEMDREIGTYGAVEAFRRLILDRLKSTELTVKRAHEGQQHARRAVMAAGGAIFTGFFAFEAGESILHYQHLQSRCDANSFLYWNMQQLKTTTQPVTTHATTQEPGHFCASYEDFHNHELSASGLLLLATLAISLLTAIISIRRPDEERGGHEHH